MPRVQLPANLRMSINADSCMEFDGKTVDEVLSKLVQAHPKLESQLFGSDRRLHSYVNIFVDQTNIRELNQLDTQIQPNQLLLVLTALAGG